MKWAAISLLIILAGCSPANRLNRIYTKHPELRPVSEITIDTVYYGTIIYRDTTIYINLPADTVYAEAEIIYLPGKPVTIQPSVLTAETDYSKAQAWIQRTRLRLQLTDKDTTLLIQLDSAVKQAEYWRQIYETDKTVIEVVKVPEFYRIMTFVGIGMIVMVFAILLIRWWLK